MRDSVQEIVFGVSGQTLWMDAPEGRPSSITSVQVFRFDEDDTNTAQSAVSATAVDAVNTETSAAAGYDQTDQTAITVVSATGIGIGREYVITGQDGLYESVVIASADGQSLTTRSPMINAYAATASFQSTRMTATVDTTWAATASNISETLSVNQLYNAADPDVDAEPRYRAVFTYVVDGATYRREIRFDLVRYSSGHLISPIDVDNRYPGWLDRVPNDYRRQQGRGLIEEAFRAVRMDMLADGNAARWLRRQDVIGELVVYRAQVFAIELALYHGKLTDPAALESARQGYQMRYDQLVRGKHVEIGSTSGGAIVGGRTRGPMGRR